VIRVPNTPKDGARSTGAKGEAKTSPKATAKPKTGTTATKAMNKQSAKTAAAGKARAEATTAKPTAKPTATAASATRANGAAALAATPTRATSRATSRNAGANGRVDSRVDSRTGIAGALHAAPHDELLRYRDEFPILSRRVYLNSCSLGALSRRSMQALSRFQEQWNEHGAQAWYQLWMGELAALREKFARLIGAKPSEIALATNVSGGLSEIASALDVGNRRKVVANDMDFPTIAYQWLAKERTGTAVAFAHSEDRMTLPASAYARLVDDKTALVATSRVFFLSGYVQEIAQIAETAHRHGAFLVVDDYQGTGQIPIDVNGLGIDLMVSGTLKWLMGGPGVAFIYAREELIPKLRPTVTGWWASRDQFQFKTTEFAYRDDAQRLEAGTPAVGAMITASAAMDIVLEIGVDRIRERTWYLADDLIRRVRAKGWPIHSPLDSSMRSSIVMLALDRPDEVVAELTKRGIVVDFRPGLVRISPHFYNTVEENAAIVDAIDEIVRHQTVSAVPRTKGATTGTADT
jgi:selenocysteine lyase/cysteine desulfurase